MDEWSMVYVTGAADKPQALIFVGFDPGVRLKGLRRWGEEGGCERVDVGGVAGDVDVVDVDEDVEERDRMMGMGSDPKGKGKGRLIEGDGTCVHFSGQAVDVPAGIAETGSNISKAGRRHSWAWKEKAMYRDIGLGFNFGRAKKGQ
jgi:hypothetical protein